MQGESASRPGDTRADWPRASLLYAEVARRLRTVLADYPLTERLALTSMGKPGGILGPEIKSITPLVVVGSCISAGGAYERAYWCAAAVELLMASADLLDDVADGELERYGADLNAGVILTCGAGLLALATEAVARSTEDGVSAEEVAALSSALATSFASAAEGQSRSLHEPAVAGDVMAAYALAAGKSGPFGALAGWMGARLVTSDTELLGRYSEYGRCLAVHSQLLNDSRDASPEGSFSKEDVRAGAPTIPLVFAGAKGAPEGLSGDALRDWEEAERARIREAGGVAMGYAMAMAERAQALEIVNELARQGRRVYGLEALLH